jgi:hypothetical protein
MEILLGNGMRNKAHAFRNYFFSSAREIENNANTAEL